MSIAYPNVRSKGEVEEEGGIFGGNNGDMWADWRLASTSFCLRVSNSIQSSTPEVISSMVDGTVAYYYFLPFILIYMRNQAILIKMSSIGAVHTHFYLSLLDILLFARK